MQENTIKRNLSLEERNITKSEVTLIEGGVMVSRLLSSVLYYVEIGFDLEVVQLKFYFELNDDEFKRYSVNRMRELKMDF